MTAPDRPVVLAPPAVVHLIGVCGTGMGSLAGLLAAAGFRVTGSDARPYPPMSTQLAAQGIRVIEGYRPENLDHAPDLVVVGNVCRIDHSEAAAARERGLRYASMPRTLHDLFLVGREPLVVAGTHGKTTTTALLAWLLHAAGLDPSVLVGGVTADFGAGFRLGRGPHFVLEGDEYDSAYFEKRAKFLSYAPRAAVITSVEHDHVDIYPTWEAYRAAFTAFAALVDPGPLAVWAGDEAALAAARSARCAVVRYAVEGDPGPAADWVAVSTDVDGGFDLLVDGRAAGRFRSALAGRHNLRNTLAALILGHLAAGVPLARLAEVLPGFGGVARRQQVIGRPRGVTVYDDFAHHPTAVRETLAALRPRHERLLAAFEPRSATACRGTHQRAYAAAFDGTALAVIAPVGRDLPPDERLDTARLAADIADRGVPAVAARDLDEVVEVLARHARPGDGVALLSNGSFGGVGPRLLEALERGKMEGST
ncbi:MAG TPA: Mur ligase family protein [Polyangia bacterium]|nr:Mur ligase family protein [Polyangia bacterium]